jgi:hypothetical protein
MVEWWKQCFTSLCGLKRQFRTILLTDIIAGCFLLFQTINIGLLKGRIRSFITGVSQWNTFFPFTVFLVNECAASCSPNSGFLIPHQENIELFKLGIDLFSLLLWIKWLSFLMTFSIHAYYLICVDYERSNNTSSHFWKLKLSGLRNLDRLETVKTLATGVLTICLPLFLHYLFYNALHSIHCDPNYIPYKSDTSAAAVLSELCLVGQQPCIRQTELEWSGLYEKVLRWLLPSGSGDDPSYLCLHVDAPTPVFHFFSGYHHIIQQIFNTTLLSLILSSIHFVESIFFLSF